MGIWQRLWVILVLFIVEIAFGEEIQLSAVNSIQCQIRVQDMLTVLNKAF